MKVENVINYIENILNDLCLNEEDYVEALYNVLNNLKRISVEKND